MGEAAVAAGSDDAEVRERLAGSYQALSQASTDRTEALAADGKALAIREDLARLDPDNARFALFLG